MNIQDLFSFTNSLIIVKIGLLAVLFLYIIIAFVIYTQVQTMNRIITLPAFSRILTLFAIGLILAAVSLFILSLAIL